MTFNSRANSCFLKSDVSEQQPYQGAYSGFVRATDSKVLNTAVDAGTWNCPSCSAGDFDAALTQARGLANEHITGDWNEEDLAKRCMASARADGEIS